MILRFHDDEAFWTARLGNRDDIEPKAGGRDLRFRLRTEQDFQNFKQALDGPLHTISFNATAVDGDGPDTEDDEVEE
jgi:hypothetical protein